MARRDTALQQVLMIKHCLAVTYLVGAVGGEPRIQLGVAGVIERVVEVTADQFVRRHDGLRVMRFSMQVCSAARMRVNATRTATAVMPNRVAMSCGSMASS